jgi:hypothetical protein
MTGSQIENAYNELVSLIDREFRRLKQVLAEQEIKKEEELLKKIQVSLSLMNGSRCDRIQIDGTRTREDEEAQRRKTNESGEGRLSTVSYHYLTRKLAFDRLIR